MPSPPPRKIKPIVWLKEVHAQQLSSLQAREQQLVDIIEDIRSYSKQRADIERNYGQALLKLSTQLLAKKELFSIEEQNPSDENRTIQAAWRSCLEETEKLGNIRVKAADTYSQSVSERCKTLKAHKGAAIKRALDQLNAFQTDLSQSVKEFGATHQQYTDDEVKAFESRSKAESAGQKLSNKETGVFTSVTTLKKTQAKTFAKMEQANALSTSSRNGYLLELSAVNAHTHRLHTKHIPTLFKVLDDGVYDQLASCISEISQTEIDSCNEILSTHGRVVSDAGKVTPKYNLDCFLDANTVFSEQLLFHFEPVQNDPVQYLSTDYNQDKRLEIETRNWSRKVAKETLALAELHDKINQITNGVAQGSEAALETEVARLQSFVRRSEIAKLKAEARLELLRTADMPVDAMLAQATAEHEHSGSAADTQSMTSYSSGHHSDATFDSSGDNLDSPNKQAQLSPNRISQYSTHSYQSTNQMQTHHSSANSNQADNASTSQDSALATMIVIYDYAACQPDELTLKQGELLTILDHGTGDGWLRACNSDSQVGMVPENYIELYEDTASLTENTNNIHHQEEYTNEDTLQANSHNAAAGHSHSPPSQGLGYVRALYDYAADGADEISFNSGQVITLLSRDENGIDDGYWKGELDGAQGMFPSVLVEEIGDEELPPPPPAPPAPPGPPQQTHQQPARF